MSIRDMLEIITNRDISQPKPIRKQMNSSYYRDYRKKYYRENKESIAEHQRNYYKKNKEKIKQKASVQLLCACGARVVMRGKAPHLLTKKHTNFMEVNHPDGYEGFCFSEY